MTHTYKQVVPPPRQAVDPKFHRSRNVAVLIVSICGRDVSNSEKMTLLDLLWREVDNEARLRVGKAMAAIGAMA